MHDPWTRVAAVPRYRRKPFRMRPIVEVWHHDPSDYDSTCGEEFRRLTHWRHWRLRIVPLRRLVRRVIDRCAHCGGPGTKANPVNISHGHADDLPWWWGHPNVYHRECSQTVERCRACQAPLSTAEGAQA